MVPNDFWGNAIWRGLLFLTGSKKLYLNIMVDNSDNRMSSSLMLFLFLDAAGAFDQILWSSNDDKDFPILI